MLHNRLKENSVTRRTRQPACQTRQKLCLKGYGINPALCSCPRCHFLLPKPQLLHVKNELLFCAFCALFLVMTPVELNRMSPPVRRESVPPSLPPPTPGDIPAPGPQAQYRPFVAWAFQPAVNSVHPSLYFQPILPSTRCHRFSSSPATLPPGFGVRQSSAAFQLAPHTRRLPETTPLPACRFSFPPSRPARLGALKKMREAASGVLSIDPVARPKKVEKLSFGPHRLACTSKAKKLFPAPNPHLSSRWLRSSRPCFYAENVAYPSNPGLSHIPASHQPNLEPATWNTSLPPHSLETNPPNTPEETPVFARICANWHLFLKKIECLNHSTPH